MSRVLKRGMRDPPRTTIINRIITLNEKRLVRPLRVLEIPTMIRVRLHGVGLAFAVWIDQGGWDEVAVGDGIGVCEGEGISEDGFDGTPDLEDLKVSIGVICRKREERGRAYVDDLETLLEKLVGFIWEVVLDAIFGRFIGLVDVDSLAWATEGGRPIASILGGTANRVVKDEDSISSSSVRIY